MSLKIKMQVLLAGLALMALIGYCVSAHVGNAFHLAASAVWGA